MVNNEDLGREFRKQFINGLRRLIQTGELRLEKALARLQDQEQCEAWLKQLKATDWNVFIEGPPHGRSQPTHVIKYMARYMSGGPIANSRLISHENGKIRFWARTKDASNKPGPFTLRGEEFVRRWSMHILPKGYTRSRSYGGFHCSKRAAYLDQCRELLKITEAEDTLDRPEVAERPEPNLPKCDRCQLEMNCVDRQSRPSWRDVFDVAVYRDRIYNPLSHIHFSQAPKAHVIGGYG